MNEYRRYLPRRGSSGSGLVQFWGPKMRRRYKPGDKPPAWEPDGAEDNLRTVEVSAIDHITDAKR